MSSDSWQAPQRAGFFEEVEGLTTGPVRLRNQRQDADFFRKAKQVKTDSIVIENLHHEPRSNSQPTPSPERPFQRGPRATDYEGFPTQSRGPFQLNPWQRRILYEEPFDQDVEVEEVDANGMNSSDARLAITNSPFDDEPGIRTDMFALPGYTPHAPTPQHVPSSRRSTRGGGSRPTGPPRATSMGSRSDTQRGDSYIDKGMNVPKPTGDHAHYQASTVEAGRQRERDTPKEISQDQYLMAFGSSLVVKLGVTRPSAYLTDSEIISCWETATHNAPLNSHSRKEVIAHANKVAQKWRDGFQRRALEFLNSFWATVEQGNTSETRRSWIEKMDPPGEKCPPFYYREYREAQARKRWGVLGHRGVEKEVKNGIFQSRFIASALSTHIELVQDVDSFETFPAGALAQAVVACKIALDTWRTGDSVPGQLGAPYGKSAEFAYNLASGDKLPKEAKEKILKAADEFMLDQHPYAHSSAASSLDFIDGDNYN